MPLTMSQATTGIGVKSLGNHPALICFGQVQLFQWVHICGQTDR